MKHHPTSRLRVWHVLTAYAFAGCLSLIIAGYQGYCWWCTMPQRSGILQAEHEIKELRTLGFEAQDEAVRLLENRITRLRSCLNAVRKNPFTCATGKCEPCRDHLHALIELHKNMLTSYRRDLRDFEHMGVPKESALVGFARSRAEHLEQQLSSLEVAYSQHVPLPDDELKNRLSSMREEASQVVAQYKKELRACRVDGAQPDTKKVAYVQDQIRRKMRFADDLTRLMGEQ